MAANLEVILSAEGKQLTAAMQKAEKDVQGLENELKDLPKAFEGVDRSVSKTAAGLKAATASTDRLTKGIKLSDDALKKLQPSSNASAQSLLNLGRVAQDAPFGILGIANNVNPLLESFQRLQKETGSTKTALKSLVSGLTGAGGLGLAVSVVSSLLIVFGDKLFGAKEASKASEEALRSFSDALESVKDNVKLLSDELQFANQLGGINIKIRGAGELQDLIEQSVAQRQQTADLEVQRDKLKSIGQQIANDASLNAKDRLEADLNYFKELKSINSEINKSNQDQSIIYRRIAFQRIEDQKKANEEAKKLNDKFIDATIQRAKRLSAFINKITIRFAPFELDPELTRGEQFKEAIKFIQRGLTERSTFELKPQILIQNPVLLKAQSYFASLAKEADGMLKDLQEEINKLTKRNPILIKAERVQVEEKARGQEFAQALGVAEQPSLLTQLQKDAINAANAVNNVLQPAFEGLFNAIKSGENPIKAFFQGIGNAVLQLIQKLIAAAVQALVIQAVLSAAGLGGTAGSTGSIIGKLLGFRAEGGPVFANQPYVVGERGPELFVPQGGGRIIPNNEMNTGLAGIGGGFQNMKLSAVLRGRDIILSNARENRSQNRNV